MNAAQFDGNFSDYRYLCSLLFLCFTNRHDIDERAQFFAYDQILISYVCCMCLRACIIDYLHVMLDKFDGNYNRNTL